jgi:hypothetical protein
MSAPQANAKSGFEVLRELEKRNSAGLTENPLLCDEPVLQSWRDGTCDDPFADKQAIDKSLIRRPTENPAGKGSW